MTRENAMQMVLDSLDSAEAHHPDWHGARHGHSLIEEEYEEFKADVFADDLPLACVEASQLAALCLRFIMHHSGVDDLKDNFPQQQVAGTVDDLAQRWEEMATDIDQTLSRSAEDLEARDVFFTCASQLRDAIRAGIKDI